MKLLVWKMQLFYIYQNHTTYTGMHSFLSNGVLELWWNNVIQSPILSKWYCHHLCARFGFSYLLYIYALRFMQSAFYIFLFSQRIKQLLKKYNIIRENGEIQNSKCILTIQCSLLGENLSYSLAVVEYIKIWNGKYNVWFCWFLFPSNNDFGENNKIYWVNKE